MKVKLTVVQRVENPNNYGIRMVSQPDRDSLPVKLEIGDLSYEQATNFPLGRVIEITIPTYVKEKPSSIITLNKT